MTFEGERIFVGVVCLVLTGLVGLRILRGLRSGRLPLYRAYVGRQDSEGKFRVLMVVQLILLLLMAFIAADLLLGLGIGD